MRNTYLEAHWWAASTADSNIDDALPVNEEKGQGNWKGTNLVRMQCQVMIHKSIKYSVKHIYYRYQCKYWFKSISTIIY